MKPTTRKIAETFKCDKKTARMAVSIINGTLPPALMPTRFPNTCEWIAECCNVPSDTEIALEALDELLPDCYGVESVADTTGQGIFWYLNRGDTYDTTIIYSKEEGWMLASWGDLVEELESKGHEIN